MQQNFICCYFCKIDKIGMRKFFSRWDYTRYGLVFHGQINKRATDSIAPSDGISLRDNFIN